MLKRERHRRAGFDKEHSSSCPNIAALSRILQRRHIPELPPRNFCVADCFLAFLLTADEEVIHPCSDGLIRGEHDVGVVAHSRLVTQEGR